MKQKKKQKKPSENLIVGLFRDAFLGGNEYQTVKGERSPFPFAVIAGVIVTTLLFLMLMFSLIRMSELSTSIANMRKELVTVTAKADTLEGEFSRRYPYAEIEAYAEEHGLSADGGRVVILPDEEETTEEKSGSDSLLSAIHAIFQKIGELFR